MTRMEARKKLGLPPDVSGGLVRKKSGASDELAKLIGEEAKRIVVVHSYECENQQSSHSTPNFSTNGM